MGTSWCRERGAREENTRLALSITGEVEDLKKEGEECETLYHVY